MAINAPDACVIGGEAAACQAVLRRLGGAAVAPVDYAIAAHAPVLAGVAADYRRLHLRPTADVPGVRFYSGATGDSYQASADRAADALVAHLLTTIDFVALINHAWADGVRVFIEHGPQAQCTGWIRRILGDREHVSVALDAPGGQATRQLCRAVAELVAAGVPMDAAPAHGPPRRRRSRARPENRDRPLRRSPPADAAPGRQAATHDAPRASGRIVRGHPRIRAPRPRASPRARPGPGSKASPGTRSNPATTGPGSRHHAQGPKAGTGRRQLSRHQPHPQRQPHQTPAHRPQPAGLPGLAAAQFRHATALHRDYLARMTQAQAEFLRSRQQVIAALAAIAHGQDGVRAIAPAPANGHAVTPGPAAPRGPSFDRAQLEYLADGKVSALFGPAFAVLDDRPKQTRLPRPPMLLADRVTGIDAVQGSMGTGTIWTQTDIPPDAWYLDPAGRMPAGLMIEAGQADLLLISWLGIDLIGHGDRVYRLLGCEVTFHGSPALAGQTLEYEIQIYQHAEHDGVRIFFFRYDCYVGDELRISVRDGQAGFFTAAELASADGVPVGPGPAGGRRRARSTRQPSRPPAAGSARGRCAPSPRAAPPTALASSGRRPERTCGRRASARGACSGSTRSPSSTRAAARWAAATCGPRRR